MNAKKTKADAEMLRKFPVSRGAEPYEMCSECGHTYEAHIGTKCPATPPSKAERPAVKVDEAKTDFVKGLEAATGATAAKELEAKALERFKAEPVELPTEILPIKLVDIRPNPRNPREKLTAIPELAAALEAEGMQTPITVRYLPATGKQPDAYEIISGHRRFAAAHKLDWETVPCIILEGIDEGRALELNLVEQVQRAELTPLEEGKGIDDLIMLSGYSIDQVAAKFGQSANWVRGRVSLFRADPAVKKALSAGELSITLATAVANLRTPKEQQDAVKTMQVSEWDRGVTDALRLHRLHEKLRPLRGAPFDTKDADLVPAAGACTTCRFNSAANQMPGLFDNPKAPPTCGNTPCFDEKAEAAWAAETAKYAEKGAVILPIEEGAKLYQWGQLSHGSKYCEASAIPNEDKAKKSWKQNLAELDEEARPLLHVARDTKGKVHELYLETPVVKALAKAKVKWAQNRVKKEARPASSTPKNHDHDGSKAQKEQIKRDAEEGAKEEVLVAFAKKVHADGPSLIAARAVARGASNLSSPPDGFWPAIGMKDPGHRDTWMQSASINTLLAFAAVVELQEDLHYGSPTKNAEFKEVLKATGLDFDAMVKARVATATAEVEKKLEAKKAKKGKAA